MTAKTAGDRAGRIGQLDPGDVGARVLLGELRERMFGRRETTTIGRFEIRVRLGRGAQGTVYLAEDTELRRLVALKLLSADACAPASRARLLREAHALARLKHPNVLTIHDVGVEADRVFIAMEYVEAGTLAQWCAEHPPGTRARFVECLALAIGAARGLAAAHEAGIVHGDVKPANILVGADGRPRVADFGLARSSVPDVGHGPNDSSGGPSVSDGVASTPSSQVAGTPSYMAPEQFLGRGDAASDQWSLCVALWEAAYGQHPFDEEDRAALAAEARRAPRPPSERAGVPRWPSVPTSLRPHASRVH